MREIIVVGHYSTYSRSFSEGMHAIMQRAFSLARECYRSEVATDHILLAALSDQSFLSILERFEVRAEDIRSLAETLTNRITPTYSYTCAVEEPQPSNAMMQIVGRAYREARRGGRQGQIGVEHLLLALVGDDRAGAVLWNDRLKVDRLRRWIDGGCQPKGQRTRRQAPRARQTAPSTGRTHPTAPLSGSGRSQRSTEHRPPVSQGELQAASGLSPEHVIHQEISANSADSTEIVISIIGRRASCVPAPMAALESLTHFERSYRYRGRSREWQCQPKHIYTAESNGSVTIPVGSVARVEKQLQRLGHNVIVRDARVLPERVREHDADFYQRLDGEQRSLCDLILKYPQFTLTSTERTASVTMGLVAALFPEARIFISAPGITAQFRGQIVSNIATSIGGEFGRAIGLSCENSQRVVIGTPAEFAATNEGHWDILILPHADLDIVQQIADGDRSRQCYRIYAFSTSQAQLSMNKLLGMEDLVGPMINDSDISAATPQITAAFCSCHVGPLPVPSGPPGRKRSGIWFNTNRNRLIAEIATAFADGDAELLASRFCGASNTALYCGRWCRIVILVDSSEHGRELARLLPNWTLCAVPDQKCPPGHIGGYDRRIVTISSANVMGDLMAHVVVRATGGEGGIRRPIARSRSGSARPAMIVDFIDDFEETFLADSRSRVGILSPAL